MGGTAFALTTGTTVNRARLRGVWLMGSTANNEWVEVIIHDM